MSNVSGRLTVYFAEPFWIGVFERYEDGKLAAAKVTFGAEPKDYEINDFIRRYYYRLQFGPAVESASIKEAKKNPKRMLRDVKKQQKDVGTGTKSQQALKLLQEQNKQERRVKSKEMKLAREERLFALKQQKKKEKHRGH